MTLPLKRYLAMVGRQETVMAYLERFEPPNLPSGVGTLRSQLEFGMLFHARQAPPSPSTSRLLTMYMITTDKAAREYTAGCRRVKDHMDAGGSIQAFVEGVGRFENCINSAKRALRALGRLGTQQNGPVIDRTIRKLAQSQATAITYLRDAIEHMDADIVTGAGISDGDPHLLTINKQGDHLEIGRKRPVKAPVVFCLREARCDFTRRSRKWGRNREGLSGNSGWRPGRQAV